MKKKFLDYSIKRIRLKNYLTDSDERICRYSLELMYSLVTKLSVILIIATIFNIFFETLLLIVFYTFFRLFAAGIHASRNLYCWIFSIILYIIIPLMIKFSSFTPSIYYTLFIVFGSLMVIYSPADTEKKPILRKNKRDRNKLLVLLLTIICLVVSIISNNSLVDNAILYSVILQSICVNPLTYKIFKMQYNNYLHYKPTKV